jgi:hypothetical protein
MGRGPVTAAPVDVAAVQAAFEVRDGRLVLAHRAEVRGGTGGVRSDTPDCGDHGVESLRVE